MEYRAEHGKEYRLETSHCMDHQSAREYFTEIHTAHMDSVFRFCMVKVPTREIAQDITQEVFMRCWQTMREGTPIEHAQAFLFTVARNLITDWYRKKKSASLDAIREEGIEFSTDDHTDILRQSEMREALECIGKLDDASREVLVLRYVEGLPPSEIAEILGEPVNRISVRINRAIKKVQEILNRHE